MTRAAGAMLHGDLPGAVAWNPLGTLLLCGAILYVAYAAVVVSLRLRRIGWSGRCGGGHCRLAVLLLLGLNWLYLLATGRDWERIGW